LRHLQTSNAPAPMMDIKEQRPDINFISKL